MRKACARRTRADLRLARGYTVLEAGNGVEAIGGLEKSGKPVCPRRFRRGHAGDGRPDPGV